MTDTWFTTGFHFGHNNTIRYCDRAFGNVEEMDQTILERLNASGKASDISLFPLADAGRRNGAHSFFRASAGRYDPLEIKIWNRVKEEGKIDDSFGLGNILNASHFYPTPHAPRSA